MHSEADLFTDLTRGRANTFNHGGSTYQYKRSANGTHTITTEDGRTATTPIAHGMLELRGIAAWMKHSPRTKFAEFDRNGNVCKEERTTI